MAKTRADFIKEGHDNAIKMKASNPQDLPNFCNSGSWQAKAYAEGWTEGCKVVRLASQAQDSINHGDVVMPVEYEALSKAKAMKQPVSPRIYAPKPTNQPAWRTAQIHVNALMGELRKEKGDTPRAQRIAVKLKKLQTKWEI